MEQVQAGEVLGADRTFHRSACPDGFHPPQTRLTFLVDTASKALDAALAFYKALKVYPTPGDLINIYEKTVSKVRNPRAVLLKGLHVLTRFTAAHPGHSGRDDRIRWQPPNRDLLHGPFGR